MWSDSGWEDMSGVEIGIAFPLAALSLAPQVHEMGGISEPRR
jgi:hypothetical protein